MHLTKQVGGAALAVACRGLAHKTAFDVRATLLGMGSSVLDEAMIPQARGRRHPCGLREFAGWRRAQVCVSGPKLYIAYAIGPCTPTETVGAYAPTVKYVSTSQNRNTADFEKGALPVSGPSLRRNSYSNWAAKMIRNCCGGIILVP